MSDLSWSMQITETGESKMGIYQIKSNWIYAALLQLQVAALLSLKDLA